MSTTKEIETTFETLLDEEDRTPQDEQSYRITIALRPGQVTVTQIVTTSRFPMPFITTLCDNIHAKSQVTEINGSVIKIRSFLPPRAEQCSAILLVKIFNGMNARRLPL